MVDRKQLIEYLDGYLSVDQVQDYCPNGLQVEGRQGIFRLALGVTACQALLEKARDWKADALLVHHGVIWNSKQAVRIERSLRARLAVLMENEMNLLAYHLPLDRHMVVGNNAVLARKLGARQLEPAFPLGGVEMGLRCQLQLPVAADDFFARVAKVTSRDPLIVPGGAAQIHTFGVVTGRDPGSLELAARMGLDAFITGEPSEPAVHLAREEGIHLVAAGHHATERFGVQALGSHLGQEFGLETQFFDISNPV